MTTNLHALCAESTDALDCELDLFETRHSELLERARAALAEAYEAEANNPPEGHPDPEPFQAILRERAAALAQPKSVPTDDELREFIETLRNQWIRTVTSGGKDPDSDDFDRAIARAVLVRWGNPATLLQQLSAPAPAVVPVALSERLPGKGDCDAEGRCWLFNGTWELKQVRYRGAYDTHWLPHWALPLPHAREVEK